MQSRILGWPRAVKLVVVVAVDVALALLATWIAFTLRLDEFHWPGGAQWRVYALAPMLAIPVFIKFGLYRAIFRYAGQAALKATAQAVMIYCIALLGVLVWVQWPDVPRSLGVLQPLIFLFLVGFSRALARFWLANLGHGHRRGRSEGRLLIYGAGTAGVQTASAIGVSRQFLLMGFIDDDAAKIGRSINGVPVFAPSTVPDVVERLGVTDILLALPSSSRERRNKIIASLRSVPIHIRTLPGLADLATGRVTVQDFKELDIEDLLGRDPVPPNKDLLAR
ncbi:MAG: polysaccharide biosynthesis protein, partial [Pseudomonadota bacterium]|nr:polysaccharide biosynthesis protein [Pseudomonadota bacterium]